MPCFIKLIRELGVTAPIGVSLLDDYERLEELLKRRLKVVGRHTQGKSEGLSRQVEASEGNDENANR